MSNSRTNTKGVIDYQLRLVYFSLNLLYVTYIIMSNPADNTRSRANSQYRLDLPKHFSGDGTEDFEQWVRRLEVSVSASPGLSDSELTSILPARLIGVAFNYWDSLQDDIKQDYKKVKEKLRSTFGKRLYISDFQINIRARPRISGEPLEVYAAEISKLVNESFPNYGVIAKEGECFRRFMVGIDPYLQLKVNEFGATKFKEAIEFAGRIERAHHANQIYAPVVKMDIAGFDQAKTIEQPITQIKQEPAVVQSVHGDQISQLQNTVEGLVAKVDALEFKSQKWYSRDQKDYRSNSPGRPKYYRSDSPYRSSNERWYNRSPDRRYNRSPDRRYNRSPSPRWDTGNRVPSPTPRHRSRYDNDRPSEMLRYRSPPPRSSPRQDYYTNTIDDAYHSVRDGAYYSPRSSNNPNNHRSVHFEKPLN